jgi:hypothetical protein
MATRRWLVLFLFQLTCVTRTNVQVLACFTSTKVQILTHALPLALAGHADKASDSHTLHAHLGAWGAQCLRFTRFTSTKSENSGSAGGPTLTSPQTTLSHTLRTRFTRISVGGVPRHLLYYFY